MSPAVAMLIGIAIGAMLSGALLASSARKMRAALARDVARRLAPVLERRATALGLTVSPSAEIGLGRDGELQVAQEDELGRLIRLAEAIDAQEASQLGYVDTLRVSKDEVEAYLKEKQGKR